MSPAAAERRLGALYAVATFGFWGLSPIYYKLLAVIAPLEVLAHRVLWSILLLAPLALLWGRAGVIRAAVSDPRSLLPIVASTLLIGANWLVFIWAVGAGRILEVSLGYYINPLISVLFGVLFLRERLRPLQVLAVALAGIGVGVFALGSSGLPWVSLHLALTFGLYGLVRKLARLGAFDGLLLETLLLAPLSLLFLLAFSDNQGLSSGPILFLLLAASGAATALPLLWFANAARRLPLATLGFFQYLAPSLHFLLAVFLYGEPMSGLRLATFIAIWTACLLFSLSSFTGRGRLAQES